MLCLNLKLVFLLCSFITTYGNYAEIVKTKNLYTQKSNQSSLTLFMLSFCSKALKQPEANPDAKRLYDDLLSNYNRLIRPVVNNTETLTVWLGIKLSQLIEVNLKNQVMTTNLWVPQV